MHTKSALFFLMLISLICIGLSPAKAQDMDGLHVDQEGKVGVGHSAPQSDLDVKGKLHVGELSTPVPSWASALISGTQAAKLFIEDNATGGSQASVVVGNEATGYRASLSTQALSSGESDIYIRQVRDGHWHDHIMIRPDMKLHFQRRKSGASPYTLQGSVFHTPTTFNERIDVAGKMVIQIDQPDSGNGLVVNGGTVRAPYFISDVGHHFQNSELSQYSASHQTDGHTLLMWDRNTNHSDFSAGDRSGFQYYDNDAGAYHKLLDTGNMDRLNATFNTVTTTSLTETSSRRFKTDIRPIQNASDLVSRLNGVRYAWTEDGRADIGLIAEEVGEVLPELVRYEENGVDAKSLDYSHLTAVLVEAFKEKQAEVDALKSRVEVLEEKVEMIDALQKQIDAMQADPQGN